MRRSTSEKMIGVAVIPSSVRHQGTAGTDSLCFKSPNCTSRTMRSCGDVGYVQYRGNVLVGRKNNMAIKAAPEFHPLSRLQGQEASGDAAMKPSYRSVALPMPTRVTAPHHASPVALSSAWPGQCR